ncbi:MAG: segregation and condensation protein A [Patescibacteria group bacterium]
MTDNFKIKVKDFEGPLDLLLQLIEKRKMHISEISLAEVAEDFISYLERKEELPKEEVVDFIFIAACLMLIKSASLLPNLETIPAEEEDIRDLEIRLKLYQIIKSVAGNLRKRIEKYPIFLNKPRKKEPVFAPGVDLTIYNLHQAAIKTLNDLPVAEKKKPTIAVGKTINLEEVVDNLTNRLQQSLKLSFKEFVNSGKTEDKKQYKVMVVVSFLSLLELLKRGVASAQQNDLFSDIELSNQATNTPRYI